MVLFYRCKTWLFGMNDYIKIALPLALTVLLSVIGFFFSQHISDLRQGSVLAYSIADDDKSIALTLSNVGAEIVAGEITLSCEAEAPACFQESDTGYFTVATIGPVGARQVSHGMGHGAGQIQLKLALPSEAKLRIIAQKAVLRQPVDFAFHGLAGSATRLIEANGFTGKLLVHYMDFLVWGLMVSVVILMIGFGVLVRLLWLKIRRDPTPRSTPQMPMQRAEIKPNDREI